MFVKFKQEKRSSGRRGGESKREGRRVRSYNTLDKVSDAVEISAGVAGDETKGVRDDKGGP